MSDSSKESSSEGSTSLVDESDNSITRTMSQDLSKVLGKRAFAALDHDEKEEGRKKKKLVLFQHHMKAFLDPMCCATPFVKVRVDAEMAVIHKILTPPEPGNCPMIVHYLSDFYRLIRYVTHQDQKGHYPRDILDMMFPLSQKHEDVGSPWPT